MHLRRGTEVRTHKFGPGKVLESRSTGALVDVGGFSVIVPFEELDVIREIQKTQPAARATSGEVAGTRARWLRSIEALRFGIVPSLALDRLTVGYEALAEWVISQLPAAAGGARVVQVLGAFGTGKSHTLCAIRHIAAEAGYLTVHAELDGVGVSLADPGALLFQLMSTLDFHRESPTPFVELCTRAQSRGHQQTLNRLQELPKVHANYSTITALKSCGQIDEFEDQLDLLFAGSDAFTASQLKNEIRRAVEIDERSRVEPSRMVSVGIDARATDFGQALSGYARLAERAGFKGLCVTLDEFETDYFRPDRVEQTLQGLLNQTLKAPRGATPITLFIGVVPQDCSESDPLLDELVERSSGLNRPLKSWYRADLKKLAQRIFNLYAQAYELKDGFDESLFRAANDSASDDDQLSHVRTFIKQYVSALDSRTGPPTA